MQNPNGLIISGASDASGNTTSSAISTSQWVASTFMAYFSENTAAGTLQLQFSNDPPSGIPNNDFTPTNWMNVPGSQATATVSSGGSVVVYPPAYFVCRWLRVVFTRSGGAGTFSVAYNALFP